MDVCVFVFSLKKMSKNGYNTTLALWLTTYSCNTNDEHV
jgi:hypothetical protein